MSSDDTIAVDDSETEEILEGLDSHAKYVVNPVLETLLLMLSIEGKHLITIGRRLERFVPQSILIRTLPRPSLLVCQRWHGMGQMTMRKKGEFYSDIYFCAAYMLKSI
jgi:hypothetical protein